MSEIKELKELMMKQFELLNKRMESHENLTVQLIGMVADTKKEVTELKQDFEFSFKENAMIRLEVERLKREHL